MGEAGHWREEVCCSFSTAFFSTKQICHAWAHVPHLGTSPHLGWCWHCTTVRRDFQKDDCSHVSKVKAIWRKSIVIRPGEGWALPGFIRPRWWKLSNHIPRSNIKKIPSFVIHQSRRDKYTTSKTWKCKIGGRNIILFATWNMRKNESCMNWYIS